MALPVRTSLERVQVDAATPTAGHGPHADVGGLADLLEPTTPLARSVRVRVPAQLQDFAFADTVSTRGLPHEEATPPSSGPIFVNDVHGTTQCVTPFGFSLPPAFRQHQLESSSRVRSTGLRDTFRKSLEETRDMWARTATIVVVDGGRAGGLRCFFHRLLTLWSFWQWGPADLARAAAIGLAVFVVTALVGATAIDPAPVARATALGNQAADHASEVRQTRTLDQHTGHKQLARTKASRVYPTR